MDYLFEIKKCKNRDELEKIVEELSSDRFFNPCWRFWKFFEEKWRLYNVDGLPLVGQTETKSSNHH